MSILHMQTIYIEVHTLNALFYTLRAGFIYAHTEHTVTNHSEPSDFLLFICDPV